MVLYRHSTLIMNTALLLPQEILDNVPNGITIQDTEGKVVYANAEAIRIMGFSSHEDFFHISPDEISQKFQVSDESGRQLSFAHLPGRRALISNLPEEAILRFRNVLESTEHWSWVKATPINHSVTGMSGVINTFYDLTKFKRSEQTLKLLNNINSTLATILKYDVRVKKLAELIVPEMADWCAIDILSEDGTFIRKAVAHTDRKKIKIAKELQEKYPPVKHEGGIMQIIRSGQAAIYPIITQADIDKTARSEEHRELLSQLNIHSIIVVPLVTRDKTLGIITFAYSESQRTYTQDDLELLTVFAQRAATLFDNSRLYERAKRIIRNQSATYKALNKNDKSLRLALEMGKMSTWDWNFTKDIFELSDSFKKIYGISQKTNNGTLKDFLKHIYPADRKKVLTKLKKALQNRTEFEDEFRIVLPDGTVHWIYKKGEVVKNDENDFRRIVGIGMDITERKLADEKLKASETKFKSVVETSLDPIIIIDKNLRIMECNKAGFDLFEFPKEKFLSYKITDFVEVKMKNQIAKSWKKIQKNGSGRGEIDMISRTGKIIPLEYSAKADFLPNQTVLILRDITNRKLEEQRQEHLLGIASHELITPLASIKAFIALLQKHTKDKEDVTSQEYLSKIDNKADNLAHLIRDLLDMARIQQNKLDFFYEMFSIDEFLDNLIREIQVTSTTHNILKIGFVNTDIVADKHRLAQIITNLIQNAIKYSPTANRVIIRPRLINQELQISIQDFGIGIPKKEFRKIFSIFYRRQSKTAQKVSGLGVGLFITAEIIKSSGGKIWLESSLNKGSTFYFTIPLVPKEKKVRTGGEDTNE